MKISIAFKELDSTPSIKEYAEIKLLPLAKFMKPFDPDGAGELDLVLRRTTQHHRHGDVFSAEAHLKLPRKSFRASEEGPDVRTAIDAVKDKLRLELEREKDIKIGERRAS